MRYLGKISGNGVLKCNDEKIARASYDFDVFLKKPTELTSCGEDPAFCLCFNAAVLLPKIALIFTKSHYFG